MVTKERLVSYLTESLMLTSPTIVEDPSFKAISESLESIVEQSARRIGKDISEIVVDEEYILILYAKLEIYQRLALAVAPEFDVTLEQSSFKKATRFTHYTELAKQIQDEIATNPSIHVIVNKPITIASRDGYLRNYTLAKAQPIEVNVVNKTNNTVDIDWTRFNTDLGRLYRYRVLYSKEPLYDEFEDKPLKVEKAEKVLDFYDINKTKHRIKGLEPNTHYYIVVEVTSKARASSIALTEVDTVE